ncbi:MAG: hypothetical protein NWE92_04045 [Candidatus Bathyarchaeota archaeon]|nr:hypothetical protein [Candidatus Bathyarchaeota archaeon]
MATVMIILIGLGLAHFATTQIATVTHKQRQIINPRMENHPFEVELENDTSRENTLLLADIVGFNYQKYMGLIEEKPNGVFYTLGYSGDPKPSPHWSPNALPLSEYRIHVGYSNNDNMISFYISSTNGSLLFTQSDMSTLDQAKAFLEKYQDAYHAVYTQNMRNALNNISAPSNVTQKKGDLQMEIFCETTNDTDISHKNELHLYETFRWSRTVNGIPNPYDTFSLTYKDGKFKSFVDHWNHYPIDNATIKVDQVEAIKMAETKVTHMDWSVPEGSNVKVVDMKASLSFDYKLFNTQHQNGCLYPIWTVTLTLNHLYPSGAAGKVTVMIRADTGEIEGVGVPMNLPP